MEKWYARPVFFVGDMPAAVAFYVERLGFEQTWRHEEDGRVVATQVQRDGCEVILNTRPDRAGGSRLFLTLAPADLAELQRRASARSVPITRGRWGMPVVQIQDPDGNELLFPHE